MVERCVFVLMIVLSFSLSALAAEQVVFTPKKIDSLLANPGMGWQTFHKFADDDPSLAGLPSSSAYFRLYWFEIEPAEGRIDFGLIDSLLARAHNAHQKLAFRIMCIGTDNRAVHVPAWLKEQGCPGFEFSFDAEDIKRWVPDMDSPQFKEAHFRLIRELGKRYDGHPDLDLMDIGTVGLWGEWHMSQTGLNMPTDETLRKVIDVYLESFPRTNKVMLIGGKDYLRYAIEKSCGWRADCLGDMGGFSKTWNHMENMYPQAVEDANAVDTWKIAPVAFENCWTMKKWKDEGWCIPCIFDYCLAYHASYVNNKSAQLPEGSRADVEKLLLRLGYRLVLESVSCGKSIRAGSPLPLAMRWENAGVAPPYRDYRLVFRLTDSRRGKPVVLATDVSVKGWLPGSIDITASPVVPAGTVKGNYTLSIAVVDPQTKEPVVNLAIEGRDVDGWYSLGTVEIR